MVVFAQFAKRSGRGDDDKIVDLPAKNLAVEQVASSGCEAILLDPAVVRVGGAALMPGAGSLILVCHILNCRGSQTGIGLVSRIAKQIELLTISYGYGRSLGDIHFYWSPRLRQPVTNPVDCPLTSVSTFQRVIGCLS